VRLDPIVIVPYDSTWPDAFDRERRRISPPFGVSLERPIEHIGSTAVVNLAAKPIIDMLAVVTDIDMAAPTLPALRELGWLDAAEAGDAAERRLSLCFPSVERRTHHLHVVEWAFDQWRGWIAFRDHMRAHPELVVEYAELKRELAIEHGADPDQRAAYRAGKANFIRAVTDEALKA
jgi:GrpB-like predicted nucleotidyltransferase (UPF0157 family)